MVDGLAWNQVLVIMDAICFLNYLFYLSLRSLRFLRYLEKIAPDTKCLLNAFRSSLLIDLLSAVVVNELDSVDHFAVMLLDLFASVCPFRQIVQPFEYYRTHFAVMAALNQLKKKNQKQILQFKCVL